jgi:hypothetical protein
MSYTVQMDVRHTNEVDRREEHEIKELSQVSISGPYVTVTRNDGTVAIYPENRVARCLVVKAEEPQSPSLEENLKTALARGWKIQARTVDGTLELCTDGLSASQGWAVANWEGHSIAVPLNLADLLED